MRDGSGLPLLLTVRSYARFDRGVVRPKHLLCVLTVRVGLGICAWLALERSNWTIRVGVGLEPGTCGGAPTTYGSAPIACVRASCRCGSWVPMVPEFAADLRRDARFARADSLWLRVFGDLGCGVAPSEVFPATG